MRKLHCKILPKSKINLPKSNRHFGSFLKSTGSKFRFTLMHEMEVFLILDNLDGKKSFVVDKRHPFWPSDFSDVIFDIYKRLYSIF